MRRAAVILLAAGCSRMLGTGVRGQAVLGANRAPVEGTVTFGGGIGGPGADERDVFAMDVVMQGSGGADAVTGQGTASEQWGVYVQYPKNGFGWRALIEGGVREYFRPDGILTTGEVRAEGGALWAVSHHPFEKATGETFVGVNAFIGGDFAGGIGGFILGASITFEYHVADHFHF